MRDERELDRAIDVAAERMMSHEPSRALSHNVMARVREDAAPAPRRFVWATAAASVLLCAAIAAMFVPRAPTLPSVVAPRPLTVAQAATSVELSSVAASDMPTVRHVSASRVARREARAVMLSSDASPIDPLEAEPIAVVAIDVPQLDPEAPTSIEVLKIDELTIEPLAASND